ncbi:sensor histidine kinase [Pseudonocardia sp. CA-142604]|uniref:sensor histidine kinase n=1 Tax=Pseudonocardia sp. CA-142604 TaxID=3240024 RepID=UPI003D90C623
MNKSRLISRQVTVRGPTGLLATALADADSRNELAASRARIVMAADEARRRFERDLHDGAQQRIVLLALELQNAEAMTPEGHEDLREQLSRIGKGLAGALEDLRELSRGLHPAILSECGLEPALQVLARRSAVPVELEVDIDGRFEEGVEVAAYYVVSEALANAAKHAYASIVELDVRARNGVLDLVIRDNGIGGADPARGSGLMGLADRVEALGGTMTVVSPVAVGTSIHVELPAGLPASPLPSRR